MNFHLKVLTRGLGLILTTSFESPMRKMSDGRKHEMILHLLKALAQDNDVAMDLVRRTVSPTLRQYFEVLTSRCHDFNPILQI